MPTYKAAEYKSALLKKGFQLDRQTDDYLYYFYYKGKKTSIHTKVSMGRTEDIGAGLLSKIRNQLRLDTAAQIRDFIQCPMEHADYIQHLATKGVIKTTA